MKNKKTEKESESESNTREYIKENPKKSVKEAIKESVKENIKENNEYDKQKSAGQPMQYTGQKDELSYSFTIKIPKERIAVIIGKNGETKKQIEDFSNCQINIDSNEGDAVIEGKDTVGMFTAKNIIKAIARGFNPDIALLLLKPEYSIEIITISEFTGKNYKKIKRFKGRVIGTEGKSRKTIEILTETYISVYGKTISIIGEVENVLNAKKAIESLLAGSPHATVYKWLEKIRAENKRPQEYL